MKKTDHFCFTDNKILNLWSEKDKFYVLLTKKLAFIF